MRATRRAVAPIAIALGAAGTASGAAWYGFHWLTTSERFQARVIECRGNDVLTPDEVTALSGVRRTDNVFRLDTRAVAQKVAESPWVSRAEVRRQLPDRIVIEVQEHRAAALAELGGLYLVAGDGRVFKRASIERGEGQGLVAVTGLSREQYLADPAAASRRIRAGLTAARRFARNGERPRLGEIHLDPRGGITLRTYDTGMAIRLGNTPKAELGARLRQFDAVWAALQPDERDTARTIHINSQTHPERVTIAFGKGQTNAAVRPPPQQPIRLAQSQRSAARETGLR